MSFIVNRVQSNVCAAQLCNEINANVIITTLCESVRIDDGDQIQITFAVEPSAAELTELDTVVLPNHVCIDIEEVNGFLVGSLYQLVFVKEASDVAGTWLSHYGDTSMNSNQTFGVIPWKSKIVGLSFSNRDNDSDTDIRIYSTPQGGGISPKTNEFTWVLRDARAARKTDFTTDIILDAGDHIGVFAKDQGINPDYVVFIMYLQIIEETFEENVESFTGDMAVASGGGSD